MTSKHLSDPELDPTRHGFFTREGGVSGGIYTGLNCGRGSDDAPESVQENRALAAEAMGLPANALRSVHQIHSNKVVEVTTQWPQDRPHADAMVTKAKGIGLGILTADCAPVLFTDSNAEIIGAAHAGWKGAMRGVTDSTIKAMIKLGATRENITATIGPCISQASYEVGVEFFETFADENPEYTRFFINGKDGKMRFDLPAFVLYLLRNAEIKTANWIGECTYASPQKYFSYRRTTHDVESDYGRQISIIRL